MNKITIMVAAAASFAAVSAAFATSVHAGEVLDRVLKTKTLTAAVGTDWAPAYFLDKGEIVGYDIDVARQIAKHLGAELKLVTPGWDLIAAGKWGGRWDIGMGQMTPTPARTEKFDLSVTYFYQRSAAVVHKDSKATKPSDLDGKRIGATSGSVDLDYANHKFTPGWVGAKPIVYEFTPGEVKSYETASVALDDLRLGDGVRLDGVITDESYTANAIKSGYPIKAVGTLFSSPAVIAIEKGDKEFSEQVAAAVQSMREDGTLSKLSIKWYGKDFSVAN
ncbi:transporter substrate-binding domain-containing protein [Rhizobium sp. NXC24]|uniref:transporter substrate-binding domain-containing protein n=1 Tax=Rhizobium sp. NXC24 TaxID=2048897 RepID=UPI000CDF452A|nr:transporter substrate-binding domain-containing protein [Rhizobium sp. NXC24]AVA24217.1 ABC transporter substrate-binding protein [Rhizobium sp. NXC24]